MVKNLSLNNQQQPKWVFPKKGVKMDGLLENPIKMDDLGVPLFLETSKSTQKFLGTKRDCTKFLEGAATLGCANQVPERSN